MAYDYASDPFYQDYQRQMRRVRSARPSKDAPLRLDVPNRKFSDEQIRRAMDVRNAPARPDTGATAETPRTFAVEWAANKLRDLGLLSPEAVDSAVRFDNEWTGLDSSNQSFQNIVGSRSAAGDPTVGDYANVLINAPVIGGLAVKPLEMLAAKAGRGAMNLGRRALGTRAGRYLTEARPLLDNADDAIETAFTVTPGAQRRITNQRPVVQGLPAPEQRLGLPAPGPGLPPLASKPRGGQWWINKEIEGVNSSPEAVASQQAGDLGYRFLEWQPDDDYGLISLQVPEIPKEQFAVQDWLSRALAKYYKNDFGSPEDPLRALAERGLHYDPDMTPEKWKATVDSYLLEDPVQSILFPPNREGGMPGAGSDLRGGVLSQMPWLAKAPVTDNVYGITGGGLDLEHFADEFYNALNPEVSGIPSNLAVRKESLGRMTFPQAAEHVGRINQWRAKEMERAALDAQNNPVTHVFKEYTENNPMGLRWVEMAPPKGDGPTNYDVEEELSKALKYEGDTMGHCVGGYCPDVMSGRSRIFSLRDAKGEPHVTIETGRRDVPRFNWDGLRHRLDEDAQDAAYDAAMTALRERGDDALFDYEGNLTPFGQSQLNHEQDIFAAKWLMNNGPEGIIQIKGKQNRAPKDDYLPFVQDFVKSGQWTDVGDLANTGLVRLPDGRYLTHDQMDEIIRGAGLDDLYQSYDFNANGFPRDPAYMDPEDWAKFQHHFQGYARGGRALAAKPCSCDHSFSVR